MDVARVVGLRDRDDYRVALIGRGVAGERIALLNGSATRAIDRSESEAGLLLEALADDLFEALIIKRPGGIAADCSQR